MNEEDEIEGRVTAWGLRLAVPAGVIKGIGLVLQDKVAWTLEERDGRTVAVLSKKELYDSVVPRRGSGNGKMVAEDAVKAEKGDLGEKSKE